MKQINREKTGLVNHVVRDAILFALAEADGPMSPLLLTKQLKTERRFRKLGISGVAYHVKQLRQQRCIKLKKTEPRRGATEHFYVLRPGVVVEVDADAQALDAICNVSPNGAQDGVLNEIAEILRASGRSPQWM